MYTLWKFLKNTFVPTLDNNLRPYALRHTTFTIVVVLVIVLELGFWATFDVLFHSSPLAGDILPAKIVERIVHVVPQSIIDSTNVARRASHLPELRETPLLETASNLKAEDMATRGYFAHKAPTGEMPWVWMDKVNYVYTFAGENLAKGFYQAPDVVNAWMKSTPHRANILNNDFKDIGVGIAKGMYKGEQTVFVVQFFGTTEKDLKLGASTFKESSQAAALTAIDGILINSRGVVRLLMIPVLLFLLAALVIPFISIYRRHRSSSMSIRIREIFMLYRNPLMLTGVICGAMGLILILNSLTTATGSINPEDGSYASVLRDVPMQRN